MSTWNNLGKLASSGSSVASSSIQKTGAGLGTLASMGMGKPSWDAMSNSSRSGKEMMSEYRPVSTAAYARKLQGEEDLRQQTKAFQVTIVRQLPKKPSWKAIYNDL